MHRRLPFDRDRLRNQPQAEANFTAALGEYQDSEGLTDRAFVHRLTTSLVLWRKTRSGRCPLGFKLLFAGEDLVNHRIYAAAQESILRRTSRGRPTRSAA